MTKTLTICASFLWISVSLWTIRSCFETAKAVKQAHIAQLNMDRIPMAIPASMSNEKSVQEELRLAGMDRSPYLLPFPLKNTLFIYTLCLVMSLYVFKTAVLMKPQRENSSPEV